MQLHLILIERICINILKILHDNEYGVNKKHTMNLFDLATFINTRNIERSLELLILSGLISKENTESSGVVISITRKGNDFIQQFDKLKQIFEGKKDEPKAYQVQYGLTPLEQRMLVLCDKISSESGNLVSLHTLTQEVYPYIDPVTKSGIVSKYAKKLEQLNLIRREKINNKIYFQVTESGQRAIKEQFMDTSIKT